MEAAWETNWKPQGTNDKPHQLSWVADFLRRRRLRTMGIVDVQQECK